MQNQTSSSTRNLDAASSEKTQSIDDYSSINVITVQQDNVPEIKAMANTQQHMGAKRRVDAVSRYPVIPDVPISRPWFRSYERYSIDSHIQMPDKQTSLLEVFEENFDRYSQRTAYICMGSTISYRQLDVNSMKIAAYLQSIGLNIGDKVAVMMPNILQYPVIAFGVLRAGMVLVNINPFYNNKELEYHLTDSDAKAIFLIENFANKFQNISHKVAIKHVIIGSIGDMLGPIKGSIINLSLRHIKKKVPAYTLPGSIRFKQALNMHQARHYKRRNLDLGHVAMLQYTGGTTGVAKGAMLTHGNLIANLMQINTVIKAAYPHESNSNDIVLVALPLHHVFAFMVCGLYPMLQGGAGLLIPDPRNLDGMIKQLRKYPPTFIPAVNTFFAAMVNHREFTTLDFSNLKAAIGGGMAVRASVAKKWHDLSGLPIIEGYGLSETSPLVTFNPMNISEFTGKIGIPAPDTDVILIDENERIMPIGERGEICVKGPQVMLGYYNNVQKTEEIFTKSGYLKTGDIGIIDSKGFIKVVDRKKDMILVSGFNVYPNEIEEAIMRHPDVLDVGAIGVNSGPRGEEPKIFVVKKPGSTVDEAALIKFGRKQLTGYKRPRHVQFMDSLPKSNVGKVLRKELRKMEGLE